MNNNTNKKINVITIICLSIFCFIMCFSMFNNNIVKADDSDVVYQNYEFKGSDLYHLGAYRYHTSDYWSGIDLLEIKINTTSTYNNDLKKYITKVNPLVNRIILSDNSDNVEVQRLEIYQSKTNAELKDKEFKNGSYIMFFCRRNIQSTQTNTGLPMLVWIDGDFNSNVTMVKIGTTTKATEIYPITPNLPKPSNGEPTNYSYIQYIDINGNRLTITLLTSSYYGLEPRTYGIGEYASNFDKGYDEGYKDGKKYSYDNMKSEIIADTYGFSIVTSGIGAVFESLDKPILFGSVSLISIYSTILMFSIVMGIIKMIK